MSIVTIQGCPDGHAGGHLPLRRLRAGEKIILYLTCDAPLQMWTHFVGGRTLPHLDGDCPGCERERPKRFEAYYAGCQAVDKKHIIVGVPAGASYAIMERLASFGGLRGRAVVFERRGKRPNGQVIGELTDRCTLPANLPTAPNLMAQMIHIWGLDASASDIPAGSMSRQIEAILGGKELPGQTHLFDEQDVA